MAFVYRSQKREFRSQTTDIVGPGTYVDINAPGIVIQKNLKPFNSTVQKGINKEISNKEQLPGPGYYNIQPNNMEKIVISSPDEEIKVIEIPKPSPFFKNKQQRFYNDEKADLPGPGSYQVEKASRKRIKGMPKILNKPKSIIDHLMQINRYSSIPSIPGKQHQFGYTENESNILELNQLNNIMAESHKNLGPGCYDVKGIFDKQQRVRGVSWHQQTQNKTIVNQEKLDMSYIGPGSYETNYATQGPLYKLKQSHVFASKNNRDYRKGAKTNSFLSSRNKSMMSNSFQQPNDSDPETTDSEYEYIEDATPGPGYYHNESIMSSIKTDGKPERFQYFGSRQERFKQVKNDQQIGPGQYTPAVPSQIGKVENVAIQNKAVPFGSSNTRFETKIFQEIKPCPGQYDPRNTFEDKLINKIQRGYRGNFGSTERRFRNQSFQQDTDQPGPGSYLDPIIEKENEEIKPNSIFISKTKRENLIEKKKVVPPPGQYNIDVYDITKKVQKDDEDDPELAIKKPGFLSGQPRFKEPKPPKKDDDDDEFDDDIPTNNNRLLSELYKKKPKQVAPFGIKSVKQNNKVAPGQYYDQQQSSWNKRTFNILFAEI